MYKIPVRWLTFVAVLALLALAFLLAGDRSFSEASEPGSSRQAAGIRTSSAISYTLFLPSVAHKPVDPVQFGYGIHANRYGDTSANTGHIQALGLGWVAFNMEWKGVEISPGDYLWDPWDSMINGYHAAGIKIMLTIAEAPGWARPPDHDPTVSGPPEDPATYAGFVAAVADRYRGKVQAIEVWHGQNIHYQWDNNVDVAEYVRLLQHAYLAIKTVEPEILVISGGMVPTGAPMPWAMDDIEYLELMYDNGLDGHFDAIGARPGGYNCPASADWRTFEDPTATFRGPFDARHHSWCFLGTVEGYRAVMVAHGDWDKKIAITEFGWASYSAPDPRFAYASDNTFEEQAQWIVEAFQWGKNSGWIGPMLLWNLDFGLVAPDSVLLYWSLLRPEGPIPAYDAVASMPKH